MAFDPVDCTQETSMSIYTRHGDHGETSLADGSRVRKDSVRVEAYGAIDEATSAIGLARATVSDPLLADVLRFAQHRLFNCSAALASPAGERSSTAPGITPEDVAALEQSIDRFEDISGPSRGFILEGGTQSAALLHVARATLRRAERRAVKLDDAEPVDEHVLAFINRLSDTLFAAARYANAIADAPDELWDPSASKPSFNE
jgi:cob(I)alamin adenosyltransferase